MVAIKKENGDQSNHYANFYERSYLDFCRCSRRQRRSVEGVSPAEATHPEVPPTLLPAGNDPERSAWPFPAPTNPAL